MIQFASHNNSIQVACRIWINTFSWSIRSSETVQIAKFHHINSLIWLLALCFTKVHLPLLSTFWLFLDVKRNILMRTHILHIILLMKSYCRLQSCWFQSQWNSICIIVVCHINKGNPLWELLFWELCTSLLFG